jgi:hypothetical protein
LRPSRVAVLPPVNATANAYGADVLQTFMSEQLPWYGFTVRNAVEVRELLKSKGIVDGGQLGSWEGDRFVFGTRPGPEVLCDDLGVDGLMAGVVNVYDYIDIFFARQRKVSCSWMLITRNGTPLWIGHGTGVTTEVYDDVDKALDALGENLAVRAIEDAWGAPLAAEAAQSVHDCLQGLHRPLFQRGLITVRVAPPVPPPGFQQKHPNQRRRR